LSSEESLLVPGGRLNGPGPVHMNLMVSLFMFSSILS
jgi:hypothetical protein